MKTLTEEEVGFLVRAGEIKLTDLQDTPPPDGKPVQDTVIKDGIAALVAAIKSTKPPAPPHEKMVMPAPQVTVSAPKRGNWTATVTERDKDGYIKRVSFEESKQTTQQKGEPK